MNRFLMYLTSTAKAKMPSGLPLHFVDIITVLVYKNWTKSKDCFYKQKILNRISKNIETDS